MTDDESPATRDVEGRATQDGEGDLSYEQARDELVAIVQKLESGGAGLDESLALWERGERLATLCQEFLDGAQKRVDAARATGTQEPSTP